MTAIIGLVVVFVGVFGGFIAESGPFGMLFQPAEFLIIGGAAGGALVAATPPHVLQQLAEEIPAIFGPPRYTRQTYEELLQCLYAIFQKARREGFLQTEADINDPHHSDLFGGFPSIVEDHHTLAFICDALRLTMSYQAPPAIVELAMDVAMETHHEEAGQPAAAMSRVSDALPGLGIVAAVLGIVISLQFLSAPAEVLGHHISAALIGTFLGLLLSYGMIQPLGVNMEGRARDSARYYLCIREAIAAFIGGADPRISLEIARQAIPSHLRPSAEEAEALLAGNARSDAQQPSLEPAAVGA
ncbi:MAG: flagellar motor stator protein MotA [bacterium]|nr:flagellar motor stator protein MotA [bacterium]